MSVVAIIPAKGQSARCMGKNTRPLGGRPLFLWTVRAARQAGIERIVVSTEDAGIAKMAAVAGATVVHRPEYLTRDPAEAPDVALHALSVVEGFGWSVDTVVMLLPTSPFRTGQHIREAIALHAESGANVLSVTDGAWLGHKLCLTEGGRLQGPPLRDEALRETLGGTVLLNGAIWIATPERLRCDGHFSADGALPYYMSQEDGLDIDTETDWRLAEWLIEERETVAA